MKHRKFENSDYHTYIRWLIARERDIPKYDELGEGYVICEDEGWELAMGFLIPSNKACVLGHFASHPENSPQRSQAVDYLIDLLTQKAREYGYRYALMATNLPGLSERLKRKNFMIFEKNMTHFGKEL